MEQKVKWYTETTCVDIETGEIIKQYQIDNKEYYVVRTEKRVEIEEYTQNGYIKKRGRIRFTKQTRPTGQQKLL